MIDKSSLLQHRCNNCNTLLFKGKIIEGIVEIKCNKCGEVNQLHTMKDLYGNDVVMTQMFSERKTTFKLIAV